MLEDPDEHARQINPLKDFYVKPKGRTKKAVIEKEYKGNIDPVEQINEKGDIQSFRFSRYDIEDLLKWWVSYHLKRLPTHVQEELLPGWEGDAVEYAGHTVWVDNRKEGKKNVRGKRNNSRGRKGSV